MATSATRFVAILLLGLVTTGCTAKKRIKYQVVGGKNEYVEMDEAQARRNKCLWLIDNLEFQEKQILARNLASLIKMGPEAVPHLIKAMDNRPPKVRANCAFALGEIKDDRAVEPLEQHLRLDSNMDVRRECAQALLSFEKYQGIPLLIQTLRYAGDGKTENSGLYHRYAAIKVLKHTFGQDLGYRPQDPEPEREAAVARWESWWAKNRSNYKQ